ncbi:MAG: cold shock domain-containing protein [Candidatus Hydrothermia bacterium]
MKGKIKFFNKNKGYGFIIDNETGKDIFVHLSGLLDSVKEGDEVEFDIKDGKRGPKAINVKRSLTN